MRVLVLGAGQIGSAIVNGAPRGHEVIVRTHAQLDIVDAQAVLQALGDAKADWVVNSAAYTAVDRAEDEPAAARAVNDTAVAALTQATAREKCRLLHLSTDFVFDGKSNQPYRPSDVAHPLNVYGATKLAGERHVLEGGDGIVMRTSWVYASMGKNFVLTMLRLMRERDQLSVVCDQVGTPTWAMSAAAAVWALIGLGPEGGIYHWADLGLTSWYDFAVAIQEEAIARRLLTRAVEIVPIPSAAYAARATRPNYSVLDTSGTRALLRVPALHWRESLRRMLDELRAA